MSARLIFLGPPGAGKGTQAQLLAQQLGIPHIATGDILREAIAAGSELGQKAQAYVERGELVPDTLLADLIRERLNQPDAQQGWILDGFPRNVNQAQFLEQLLGELGQQYDRVLNLDVPDKLLVERLLARGRKDDTEATIQRRLDVYREQTAALIDYYRQRDSFCTIDGNRDRERVTEALKQSVRG